MKKRLKDMVKSLPPLKGMEEHIQRLEDHVKRLEEDRERSGDEFDKVMEYTKELEDQRDGQKKELDRIREYKNELEEFVSKLDNLYGYALPGHYYSPIPSLAEIRKNEDKIFGDPPRTLPELELNEEEQLSLLDELKGYYKELPFQPQKNEGSRFYFENPSYAYSDSIFLYSMMRHLRPKRIIEVGCGYSSCAILDTNEIFFDNAIDCTFIEPFPELFLSLIKDDDGQRITHIREKLQDVDLGEFDKLGEKDILFIDSSHVSRVNSDVNHLFFEILPLLKSGVYIHFHDIFYPFEYPKEWIYEGRAWSESYVLRAFLQYNDSFRIVLFNSMLRHFHEEFFRSNMPLVLKDNGGSFWIRKL